MALRDRRRELSLPYLDVVKHSGASAFVIENVAELRASPEYDQIKAHACKMGFDIVSDVLLAADYGAPQTRRRTVIV